MVIDEKYLKPNPVYNTTVTSTDTIATYSMKKDKEKFEYEVDTRKAFFAGTKQAGGFPTDASDFIEVTEWSNCEGVDVSLQHNEMGGRIFQMTYTEWKVLRKLMKKVYGKI